MITCNRCGSMNPAGAGNCQMCGAPLANPLDNSSRPPLGAQRQQGQKGQPQDIPAWLESLRAGERPAKNPASFDASELIGEGTVPSWMRPERSETPDRAAPPQRSDVRPSTFPGPQTDEGSRGINARSLIDERSLPSWMQNAPGQQGGAESLGAHPIPASSLVQPDAIPDWMRQGAPPEAPSVPPAAPAQPSQPSQTSWQRQPEAPTKFTEPMQPLAHGFSAGELLDQQSVPAWMAQPNAQPGTSAPSSEQGRQPGQPGFSAASLLDANALPGWLQERAQGQQGNPAIPAAQAGSPFGSQPSQRPQPPQQPAQPSSAALAGGGISASSFLDKDSLPGWLTGAANQSQGGESRQGTAGHARLGGFGESPRVENVRVPSRPRSELHASEGSEVAANVFASMLGVASAPNYPAPQPNAQGPQSGAAVPPSPAQMPPPTQAAPANPFAMPNSAPQPSGTSLGVPQPMPQNTPYGIGQGYQVGASQPGLGQPPQPLPGYSQLGQSNIYPPQGNLPNNYYTMGSSPAGMPPGMSNTPILQQTPNNEQRPGAKPAKRSLFNAIREWLSPSR